MRTFSKCQRIILLALFCLVIACTTRGPKDRNDAVRATNNVKFSRTEIKDDATFTSVSIDDGLFQVEAARLATKHAHADDVIQLGQLLLEDHTNANKQLRRIASSLNISFPVELSNDNQQDLNNLQSKNGVAFDEAYTSMIVKRLHAMINSFEREAQTGAQPDLKKWASDKIIVLQMDLEMSTRAKAAVNRER